MELRLEHCTLRPWRQGDETSLARHLDDRRTWLQLRDRLPSPYTLDHAREWIGMNLGIAPPLNLAIEVGGHAVGSVGVVLRGDVHRSTAELGYWLGAAYWNRGIATCATSGFVDYAFATFDVIRLEASVFETNPASARVLEKIGFVREGVLRRSIVKNNRVLDSWLYARLRDDVR